MENIFLLLLWNVGVVGGGGGGGERKHSVWSGGNCGHLPLYGTFFVTSS